MKYLFVVAHPDDEVLGAGGLIYNLIKSGKEVKICFMCSGAEARKTISDKISIREQAINSLKILGISESNIIFGTFQNIKMNTIPHIDIVKFIESTLIDFKPNVVITHYTDDLNSDHKITSECCDEAIRYFQRNNMETRIDKYMYMEVLSSTDWVIGKQFIPNYFYEIGDVGLEKKIEALKEYDSALRQFPHPRSEKNIRALATIRGCQSGQNYSEGFLIAFEFDKEK